METRKAKQLLLGLSGRRRSSHGLERNEAAKQLGDLETSKAWQLFVQETKPCMASVAEQESMQR